MFRLFSILLLTALCSATGSLAQRRDALSRKQIDSLVNPKAIEQSVLVFEQSEQQIPNLSEDDAPVSVDFRFANRGAQPLVITRVVTSCGCLATDWPREPIPAGGKGTIRAVFKPKGHPGQLFRKIFVYTNLSQQSPTVRLAVTGHVRPTADKWNEYPYAMGALRCRRRDVTLRNTHSNSKVAECIECINAGDKTLHLTLKKGSTPAYLTFRTSVEILEPGKVADLIFILNSSQIPHDAPSVIKLDSILEGIDCEESLRKISVEILLQ